MNTRPAPAVLPIALCFLGLNACAEKHEAAACLPALKVSVIFGYKDARPARFVGDRYEEALFAQAIQKTCVGSRLDCEFVPVPLTTGALHETYRKDLVRSPTCKQAVELTLEHSSVGADDASNRKNPFQAWQSAATQDTFTTALASADAVFYNGHSRGGGGPDFFPPRLTVGDHTDYTWYRRNQSGLKMIERTLRSAPHSNRLSELALFSCASEQLFAKRVEAATQQNLKILSSPHLLYFSDALQDSLKALSEFLSQPRPPAAGKAENAPLEGATGRTCPKVYRSMARSLLGRLRRRRLTGRGRVDLLLRGRAAGRRTERDDRGQCSESAVFQVGFSGFLGAFHGRFLWLQTSLKNDARFPPNMMGVHASNICSSV